MGSTPIFGINILKGTSNMSDNGKGDKPRPKQISSEIWDKNWNLVFKKPRKTKPKKKS